MKKITEFVLSSLMLVLVIIHEKIKSVWVLFGVFAIIDLLLFLIHVWTWVLITWIIISTIFLFLFVIYVEDPEP